MKKTIILSLLLIPFTFFAGKQNKKITLNEFDQAYRQFLTIYGTAILLKINNNEELDTANFGIESIKNEDFKEHMTRSIKAYNSCCKCEENRTIPIFRKMLQDKAEIIGVDLK